MSSTTTARAQDARVAALLRRALPVPRRSGAWSVQALLAAAAGASAATTTTTTTTTTATFTHAQQLLQEIHDTKRTRHDVAINVPEENGDAGGPQVVDAAVDVERLIGELYELREALAGYGYAHCGSSAERAYLALLQGEIIAYLATAVRAAATHEPHGLAGSVKDACRAVLTLCVKPSSLAREIAFSLMHQVSIQATLQSAGMRGNGHDTSLHSELFVCAIDMLVKSVAVASTQDTVSAPDESAWLLQATSCLLSFVRSSGGGFKYRVDRLVRLDLSALVLLTRRAFALTSATSQEAELQDTLLEVLVAVMYAHHVRAHRAAAAGGGITNADVERVGGMDWLLAIFYGSTSDRSRRLVLGVAFDLVVDQLTRSKPQIDDKSAWASYDSLLHCLHECDFASLAASSPLAFVTHAATAACQVKILHAVVENELLETHVTVVWSALRGMLQIDEYFAHSASLAHALKLLSSSARESTAELMVNKVHQLLMSPRLEDRFKGERWLAELLVHGLQGNKDSNNNNSETASSQQLLGEWTGATPGAANGDQLEESLCYDEAGDIRLTARAKLWELSRSSVVSSRVAFVHVLALFTKRRVRIGAPTTMISSHVQELNLCLDALVTREEDAPAVLLSVLDTVLQVVVRSYDVPYLDLQRQRYDFHSCDAPQELVGGLVASESLACKILRGAVGVDRTHVSELSLGFLLHALDVLDAALYPDVDGSHDSPLTLASDYAAVTALLVSYALDDAPVQHDDDHLTLAPFLDSRDARIAVIAARSVTTQLKRRCGDQRYAEIVRDAHAAAVESDNEAALANSVAHARMLLGRLERGAP